MSMIRADHRQGLKERGQVVVLFALLVPVILTIGSVVVSVGNWYVLKRHLQTQVDAAALAGGAVANGCQADVTGTQTKIRDEALKFSGDTARTGVYNLQPEDVGDVRIVLNSTRYWDPGDLNDGTGLDWTLGNPCTTRYLDVKATDYRAPSLFRWIPLFPSLKARARVQFVKTKNTNGVRPIGVPEFDPVKVAALFVDEGVSDAQNLNSISGRGFLSQVDPATLLTGDPLIGRNAWRATVDNVNLNNTSNHSVVILASRDANACITAGGACGNGSLGAVCNQNPIQTRCYSGGGLNDGISFIHIYSGTGGGVNPPAIRDATLSGGCTGDESRPYYNFDGVDSNGNGCTLTLTAHVDFGTGGANPTIANTCATMSIAGGSNLTWVSGDTWTGTYTFSNTPAGRYLMDLNWQARKTGVTGPCNATKNNEWNNGTLQDVQGAFVANDNSDVVEYLKLDNMTAGLTTTDGNSYPKTASASVKVSVGFIPPLRDTPPSAPPIRLRFAKGPSQTQALDCGSGANQNGWNAKMASGCDAYQENLRTPTVNCSPPDLLDPPDCIASENGNFNSNGIRQIWGQGCPGSPATPNNWTGSLPLPPDSDPRWIPLFILDEKSTTVSGKKYYPIRRFGGFYVTAGDGMGCNGDDPASGVRRTELWGHFITYFRPDFGSTIPSDELCPFNDANLCVPTLVE